MLEIVTNSAKLVPFKNFGVTSLTQSTIISEKAQKSIYRNIIVYADDIIITGISRNKISNILIAVRNSLIVFGLDISKKKSQVINYLDAKLIKFKYLSFSFVYVPIKHIKKGGILGRYDDITRRKFRKTQNGSYLVYPSSNKFRDIKSKCKSLIKLLLRVSFIEVLNKINVVIRAFAIYYTWSNSYNRLNTLDGLLFRYIQKYLIKKHKKRGIRRPV